MDLLKVVELQDIDNVLEDARYQIQCEAEAESEPSSNSIWILLGEDNTGKRYSLGYCNTKEEMRKQIAILSKTYFWVMSSKIEKLGEL